MNEGTVSVICRASAAAKITYVFGKIGEAMGKEKTVLSNGQSKVHKLPPGLYNIKFTASGFFRTASTYNRQINIKDENTNIVINVGVGQHITKIDIQEM